MNTTQKHATHGFTQFELSKKLFQNLNKFEVTPATKLVLQALANCYNPKNDDVFPKEKTLAAQLGISEKSVSRAVIELKKENIVMYQTKGKLNRYVFTPKFFALVNMSAISGQKDHNKQDKLSHDNKLTEHKKNIPSFYKNEGINYPAANILKFERDEKTPLTDRESATKWIKELTKSTLKMKPINKMFNEVILKHDFDTATLTDLNSLCVGVIKYSSEI